MQEKETLNELSKKYGIHPNMITPWKKVIVERAPLLFEKTNPADKGEKDLEKLYVKIGQLEMAREFPFCTLN